MRGGVGALVCPDGEQIFTASRHTGAVRLGHVLFLAATPAMDGHNPGIEASLPADSLRLLPGTKFH